MGNEVITAAAKAGVSAQSIDKYKQAASKIDFGPLGELVNWNGKFVDFALSLIDLQQGIPLQLLAMFDKDGAAVYAAFLQRVEDYIMEKRSEPTPQ